MWLKLTPEPSVRNVCYRAATLERRACRGAACSFSKYEDDERIYEGADKNGQKGRISGETLFGVSTAAPSFTRISLAL